MKVKWIGHSSFLITSEQGTKVLTDPYTTNPPRLKYGKISEVVDIVTVSHEHGDHNDTVSLPGKPEVLKGSGVKEVKGIQFEGFAAYHDASMGSQRGPDTIFCFTVDGMRICHLGDLGHALSDQEVANLGSIDLLLIPVGGYYTIDAAEATQLVGKMKPRVVVPMHVKNEKCDFPIATVEDFLKGKGNVTRVSGSKIELKKESLPSTTQIMVLQPAM